MTTELEDEKKILIKLFLINFYLTSDSIFPEISSFL